MDNLKGNQNLETKCLPSTSADEKNDGNQNASISKVVRRCRGQKIFMCFLNINLITGDDANPIEKQKKEVLFKGGERNKVSLRMLVRQSMNKFGVEFNHIFEGTYEGNIEVQVETFLNSVDNPYAMYIFIYADGKHEAIKMANGKYLTFINLMWYFNTPQWENIPKVFFFITSRGYNEVLNLTDCFQPENSQSGRELKNCAALFSTFRGGQSQTDKNYGSEYVKAMIEVIEKQPVSKPLFLTDFAEKMEYKLKFPGNDLIRRFDFQQKFDMTKKYNP